ncbi:DNA glycosylase [Pisolithus croceorrhizus]|nr:DNA glycosylase [Pisolithus croceorrhizus]
MSAARRVATERATGLAVKSSPYHAAVNPCDAQGIPGPSTTRHWIHMKREDVEHDDPEDLADRLPAATTKKRAKTKTTRTTTSVTITDTKSRSPRKSKVIPQSLAVPHPAPERWKEAHDAIKEMRSRVPAPVDTMGCDQVQWKEQDPKNNRFATLISLMLSSQTKDKVTDAAVAKLRTAVGRSLSVDAVIAADEATISDAISKVGFWRWKTQYIKQAAQRLRDDFDSDVPKTVDELCSLPGVGPKMAFLALQVAWKLNLGIGVDVHVHRITNQLSWHQRPTKNPEETRLNLQSWLPKELHSEINHMLVGFGQTVCLPVGPKCDSCTLSSARLCPSAQTKKSTKRESESGPKIEIQMGNP